MLRAPIPFEDKYIPDPNSGCWLWNGLTNTDGYGRVKIKGKTELAHRHAWFLKNGPIPPGLCALHKCDVPACVNPEHIFLGTNKDNNQDCVKKGRNSRGEKHGDFTRGENHPNVKLTAQDVTKIRFSYKLDLANSYKLGRLYNVGRTCINKIVNRESWKHLKEELPWVGH